MKQFELIKKTIINKTVPTNSLRNLFIAQHIGFFCKKNIIFICIKTPLALTKNTDNLTRKSQKNRRKMHDVLGGNFWGHILDINKRHRFSARGGNVLKIRGGTFTFLENGTGGPVTPPPKGGIPLNVFSTFPFNPAIIWGHWGVGIFRREETGNFPRSNFPCQPGARGPIMGGPLHKRHTSGKSHTIKKYTIHVLHPS